MKHTFMTFKTIINHHKWSAHIHEFKLLYQKELNTHTHNETKTWEYKKNTITNETNTHTHTRVELELLLKGEWTIINQEQTTWKLRRK